MVSGTAGLLDGSTWDDEDIVISGISGRFPECDSVQEFEDKLLAGINLISSDPRRWQTGLYGALTTYGMLKDLSRFDAEFFNISPKQAERMDPQIRNLLEVAHEAIVDAGLHPDDLSGTKTGVVVGVASSETQDKWSQMPDKINGYEYIGCTRTMFANRLSYKFNLKGPSYSIDTASSTTLVAFQQAYDLIRDGVCDACFVCGTDLVLNPCVCLMFQCLNMLSPEGKCKAFDASGDGYVRSEGAIAVLLQKAKNAHRVYAKVLGAGSNCDGYKDDGITFPSGPQQVVLFRKVADIAGINPAQIDFMEAHGSATRVGDPQEMNAVTEVFVKGRNSELWTGSVKSNMGHGEPASALSAVIKICVAMECGIIPPNLHYNTPNPDIPALHDGRLKVITKPTPWNGGLVAVNSFGVGGANGHALLLSNQKRKAFPLDNIPRLVCISAVTQKAAKTFLDKIRALSRDPELYALINNVHRKNIKGHNFRGYLLLDKEDGININERSTTKAPNLCLILPGIESNLKFVEPDIFNIEVFQRSLAKCQQTLNSLDKSINLKDIVTKKSAATTDNISIVAITCLQICFIDLLNHLEIIPDHIIGLNVGEIASGYADGVYSLDHAVSVAYYIQSALNKVPKEKTGIALIEESSDTDKYELPSDSLLLTDISSERVLIVGPLRSLEEFERRLKQKSIKVTVKNIGDLAVNAFLSPNFISDNKGNIEKMLQKAHEPTSKWLSYRFFKANTNQINSVSSHLLSSPSSALLLKDALNTLSNNTVFLTVSDSNSLDLKLFINKDLPLIYTNRNLDNFLKSVGRLYINGLQPQIQNLYPSITFPVSHSTPKLQSLVEWDHSHKWNVVSFGAKDPATTGEVKIVVYFDKDEFSYLIGNKLHGEHVFPKSFYLLLVWKALSRLQTKPISEISLIIENVYFAKEVVVTEIDTAFYINILGSSGKFEIWESDDLVCSGTVKLPTEQEIAKEYLVIDLKKHNSYNETKVIDRSIIYNNLRMKGYYYTEKFETLKSYNYESNNSKTEWTGNWNIFLESLLQLKILELNSITDRQTITQIRKIIINPKLHTQILQENPDFTGTSNRTLNVISSAGVEIHDIGVRCEIPKSLPIKVFTESFEFVPFFTASKAKSTISKEVVLRIAIENWLPCSNLKIAENSTFRSPKNILSADISNLYPKLQADITVYSDQVESLNSYFVDSDSVKFINDDISSGISNEQYHVIISSHVISDSTSLANLSSSLVDGGCIISEEYINEINDDIIGGLHVISYIPSIYNGKCYVILKKAVAYVRTEIIEIKKEKNWIGKIKHLVCDNNADVVLVTDATDSFEIVNIFKLLRAESKNLRLVMVDEKEWKFDPRAQFYKDQLQKNYPINVLQNGMWGSFIPLRITEDVKVSCENAFLNVTPSSSIGLIKDRKSDKSNAICSVYVASLNNEDLDTLSNGYLFSDSTVDYAGQDRAGTEFSGISSNGKRIFGLVENGALSTQIIPHKTLSWFMPQSWSFAEASSIPLSYTLAYYVLNASDIECTDSESILIFGANSITVALLNVCSCRNINTFVIAETEFEYDYIKQLFPHLQPDRLILAENDNFYVQVLEATSFKGVKAVFSANKLDIYNTRALINVLSENGVLIYHENKSLTDSLLGSAGNMKCITFKTIALKYFFNDKNNGILVKISDLIQEGLNCGEVKPLPYAVFDDNNLTAAFKHTAENKIEKTLIKIGTEENLSPSSGRLFQALPRTHFKSNAVYIVVLDRKDDFGLYVANWMVSRGAKSMVLVSIGSGDDSKLQDLFANYWSSKNVSVSFYAGSDFTLAACESIFSKTKQRSSVIGGIFDVTEQNVSNESLVDLAEADLIVEPPSKLTLVRNLDEASRKFCPNLEYFVIFSSTNVNNIEPYVTGLLHKIAAQRKSLNYPATVINWGNIGEDVQHLEYNRTVEHPHNQLLPVSFSIQKLDALLQLPYRTMACYSVARQTCLASKSKVDIILEGVAKFLGIKDPNTVRPTTTLLELGLDSLIGTDIQNFLEENCGLIFDTHETRKLTFGTLREIVSAQN